MRRIAMLKKRIGEISIMNLDKIPHDRAAFGSTVHLREDNGEAITYQLVMPEEADAAKGLISTSSPIGRAIVGKDRGRRDQRHHSERPEKFRDSEARHHPRRGVSYSPHLRTAVLLSGNGTGGAYHAGVLRALHEAGVKIDVMSGRGIGVVGALFAAIDAAPRTWEDGGVWRRRPPIRAVRWRPALQWAAMLVVLAVAILAVPLLVLATGLVAYPLSFLVQMINVDAGYRLAAAYADLVRYAFAPDAPADRDTQADYVVSGCWRSVCWRLRLTSGCQAGRCGARIRRDERPSRSRAMVGPTDRITVEHRAGPSALPRGVMAGVPRADRRRRNPRLRI